MFQAVKGWAETSDREQPAAEKNVSGSNVTTWLHFLRIVFSNVSPPQYDSEKPVVEVVGGFMGWLCRDPSESFYSTLQHERKSPPMQTRLFFFLYATWKEDPSLTTHEIPVLRQCGFGK